jgi:monofunctional glycosyltransferase
LQPLLIHSTPPPWPGPLVADPKRRRWPSILRGAARISALVGALFAAWVWFLWPPPAWYKWAWPRQTAFMAMRRAQERAALRRGEIKPPLPVPDFRPVPVGQIPITMRIAALIGEDHRFYQHAGIDYQAIREAMGYRRDDFHLGNPGDRGELARALRQAWSRRDRIRGASTITQQLAKNLYLSPSRNPLRKVKEAVTAWRLEYWLGKDRILELYLNVVELGPETWGVEAASRKYFGHPASRLSAEEAAALAGALPFPLRSNPAYRPGRMRWRQSMILRRMRGENVVIPDPSDTAEARQSLPADSISLKH